MNASAIMVQTLCTTSLLSTLQIIGKMHFPNESYIHCSTDAVHNVSNSTLQIIGKMHFPNESYIHCSTDVVYNVSTAKKAIFFHKLKIYELMNVQTLCTTSVPQQ